MKKNNSYVKFEFVNKNVKKKLYKGQKEVHNFNFYTSGKHLDYISRKTAVYVQEEDFDLLKIKKEYRDTKQYMNNSTAFNKRNKLSGVYKIFDLEAKNIDIEKENRYTR
ncbi:hypothetical protein [Metamycoplasma hyosynoviae]|nr:hypothetical protein [Metamycoplasma hyosynoviae]MDC8912869.1 hypothetical protein [Metamycoplasma hyosynoviae]MDD1374936.1 hypothetical protein [Metamycoplasma hyosynoviae]